MRRFLTRGSLPPKDAVRIEELVNYFPYDDPQPDGRRAPSHHDRGRRRAVEPDHELVRIGLRARDVDMRRAPPSNLVFLIDVSGSMTGPDKLPLVKQALALLVNELREEDHVAIVVYAGSAGLVLPSTSGSDKQRILARARRARGGRLDAAAPASGSPTTWRARTSSAAATTASSSAPTATSTSASRATASSCA